MNYQRGMLSDLAPQNNDGLARLLMYLNQPQPMMTGPMMLAQNTQNPNQLQQMLGVRGDGVSSQTKIGIEKSLPGFYETKAPEPDAKGYSLGKETQQEKALRERQELESRKAGQNDLYYKNLRQKYPNMPESEVIKRSDEQRASGRPPIY